MLAAPARVYAALLFTLGNCAWVGVLNALRASQVDTSLFVSDHVTEASNARTVHLFMTVLSSVFFVAWSIWFASQHYDSVVLFIFSVLAIVFHVVSAFIPRTSSNIKQHDISVSLSLLGFAGIAIVGMLSASDGWRWLFSSLVVTSWCLYFASVYLYFVKQRRSLYLQLLLLVVFQSPLAIMAYM